VLTDRGRDLLESHRRDRDDSSVGRSARLQAVGYALALGKPIILLAQRRASDSPLPFDLSAFRVLFYDDSIGGKPKLEAGLRQHLKQILGND
jgi:hypothetical protein